MRSVSRRLPLLAALLTILPLAAPAEEEPSPESLVGFALGAKFEPDDSWFVIRRQNGELYCTRKNRKEESTVVETDDEHRIKHVQWFHPVRSDETIERVFARVAAEKKAFGAFLKRADEDASDGEMEFRYEGEGWKRRVHCKAPFFSISIYRVVKEVVKEIVVLPRELGRFALGAVYAPREGVSEKENKALPDGTRKVVLGDGNLILQLAPGKEIIEIGERFPFGGKPRERFEKLKKEHVEAEVVLDIVRDTGFLLVFRDSHTKLRVRGDENQEITSITDRALRDKHPLPEKVEPPKPPEPEEPEAEPTREPRESVPACLAEASALGALCGHVLGEPLTAPEDVDVAKSVIDGAWVTAYALADGGKVTVGTDAKEKVIYVSVAYDDIPPPLFESIVKRQSEPFAKQKRTDQRKTRGDRLNRAVAYNDAGIDRSLDYRESEPGDLLVRVEPALPRGALGLKLGAKYEPGDADTVDKRDWGNVYVRTLEDGTKRSIGVELGRIVFISSKRADPDGEIFRKTRKAMTAKYPFQIERRTDEYTCWDGCTVLSMSSYKSLASFTLYDARTRFGALRVSPW